MGYIKINMLISLSSCLISEALYDLLKKEVGYQLFLDNHKNNVDDLMPDIILVDFNTINPKLFSQYPKSKVILIDTGIKQGDIIATLLSYRLSGILSANIDFRLFKKALEVVSKGEVWIDNSTVKAFLHNTGLLSKTGKISGITERGKEIIEYVCRGCRNKEIASRLFVSEQTVKAHLDRIFRKFNVSNRSQLVALAMGNQMGQR